MTTTSHCEYPNVLLSMLGRADVNGMRKRPLTDEQLRQLEERAEKGILTGECDHPKKDDSGNGLPESWATRTMEVRFDRASHVIAKIQAEMVDDPDGIRGKAQRITATILPVNPFGEALRAKLESGEPVYFGLRAMTQAMDDGTHAIMDVISWDWIQNDPYPPRAG